MSRIEIPKSHQWLQNSKTPIVYEWVFRTLIRLHDRIGGLVESWQVRWNMKPKRCGKSLAHALRQVELREKRKAMKRLHLEIVSGH